MLYDWDDYVFSTNKRRKEKMKETKLEKRLKMLIIRLYTKK